jgi:glyoxylase-like metal-dependent hydrolase (beta-lactamase superfamily II)
MSRLLFAILLALCGVGPALAQMPLFATTKVEGTDNVYVFRYQFHQSMFLVTPEGVIATDPISDNRPAAEAYLAEIRKITSQPIRYLIYNHHHPDHIAGGKPFKDAGAIVVAHRITKERLAAMARPDIVIPDETVEEKRTISLGGVEVELIYVGRNHSDNSLVLRLPREKLLFAVDFIPVRALNWRNMPDSYLPDWDESLKRVLALEWERLIPGHPGPGGRLGTRADVQDHLVYMQESWRRDEEGVRRGQVHRGRHPRGEATEIRHLAELRTVPGWQRGALLPVLGAGELSGSPAGRP